MVNKKFLRIFAVVFAAIIILTCFVSCNEDVQQPVIERGEFVPPPFDDAAVVGIPEIAEPDKVGYKELDARSAYKLSICGAVKLDGDKADVYFTNPESNDVWLKLRVLNEKGEVIAETGLIRPGEYLKSINFSSIPKIGDKIIIKVMGYQPDTYYSAGSVSLNTAIY